MAAEDRITIRADARQWEAIMLTSSGTRHSFSSIVAVRWLAAAIVLTIPILPSYAATDVFTASRMSGKIDSGALVVDRPDRLRDTGAAEVCHTTGGRPSKVILTTVRHLTGCRVGRAIHASR